MTRVKAEVQKKGEVVVIQAVTVGQRLVGVGEEVQTGLAAVLMVEAAVEARWRVVEGEDPPKVAGEAEVQL